MTSQSVDIAIIGAGTAGQTAYREAVKSTDSVLLINQHSWGTTCAHVGCMPSKLLIAAANRAHEIQHAEVFGLHGSVKIDGVAVMQRVRKERDRFTQGVIDAVNDWPERHRMSGHAVLKDQHTIHVGGKHTISAKKIVIATGSSPVVPNDWKDAIGERLLTTDSIFELDDLPHSIAVIGAGAVGLELAQALHRLGVKVTVFNRSDRLGTLTDPVLQANAHAVLGKELTLVLNSSIDRVEAHDQRARLFYTDREGQSHQGTFDYVLCAMGRKPNLTSMHLDQLGIELDEHGQPTAFDPLSGQISDTALFMAGDVNGFRPLLHEAANQGHHAGNNAGRYPDIRRVPQQVSMSVVFCEPQMAMVGQSYADIHQRLVEHDEAFSVGSACFVSQGRSNVMAVNQGAMRVYGQAKTGKLLGAEIFGPAAEHLAHLLAWAMQHDMTVAQMLDSPFYHPVIEEAVRTALRDLQRAMSMGPVPVKGCLDCGAGA